MKNGYIKHWLGVWTAIALMFMASAWGVYFGQEKQAQQAFVSSGEETVDEDRAAGDQETESREAEDRETESRGAEDREAEGKDNYSDNIFQLSVSVVIAVETISITIFTFLKSLLDRNTDKKNYSRKIMSAYNLRMSRSLGILTIEAIVLLVYGFMLYSSRFLRFDFGYFHWICGWLIPILIFTGCSAHFWRRCVDIDTSWRIIAEEKIGEEMGRLKEMLAGAAGAERLLDHDRADMAWNSFFYLFTKLEEILILGIDSNYSVYSDSEEKIKDHLRQDGNQLTGKLNEIEQNDIGEETVFASLADRRKTVSQTGLDVSRLYECLENCRDYLLVMGNYPAEKMDQGQIPEVLQKALQFFYQKLMLEKFRNLVIEEIIFENSDFICIDLYGARMENSILTGAMFQKAVLARMQIQNTNLTMGCYDQTLIKDARITASSLLSSRFSQTKIVNTKFIDTELSNSSFTKGEILGSSFQNSNLSDSEFIDTSIVRADFGDTILHNLEFAGTTKIRDSSFVRADISRWKMGKDVLGPFQDFTEAVMTGFELGGEPEPMDASGDVFAGAKLYDGTFRNLRMKGCVFENSNMTRIRMENVTADASSLRGANLFEATITGTGPENAGASSFRDCDLTNVNAVRATIVNTDFRGAVCSGMDLSDAVIENGDWSETKMERVILSDTKIAGVRFRKADFTGAAIEEGTEFRNCDFREAIFSDTLIRGAKFVECNLSGIRFEHCRGAGFKVQDCLMQEMQDCLMQEM